MDLTPPAGGKSGCLTRGETGLDACTEVFEVVTIWGLVEVVLGSCVLFKGCRVKPKSGRDEVKSRRPPPKPIELVNGERAGEARCEFEKGSDGTEALGVS